MAAKPPGISEVAAAAGVSMSTVSQVLGGSRPVSATTRAKVDAAIKTLGYRPNPAAQSLRAKRTKSVALLVPDITNPFYPLVAVGMQDLLLPAGYLFSLVDAALGSRETSQVIDHVLARRFDGIALGTYGLSDSDLRRIGASGMPVVTFGREVDLPASDCVESDDQSGFAKVTRHLVNGGRRRIAFIGGEPGAHPNVQRAAGYRGALQLAGMTPESNAEVYTAFTRDGGREGVNRLYAAATDWDAIVCANDLVAIGAMDELRRRGIDVPGQVAVTGYDDIEAASLVQPALTTVENPAREIGRAAARLLLTRFADTADAGVHQHVVLSNRLIVRGSAPGDDEWP